MPTEDLIAFGDERMPGCCSKPGDCSIVTPVCAFNHGTRKREEYRWRPTSEQLASYKVAYLLHGADHLVYHFEEIAGSAAEGMPYDILVRGVDGSSWVPAPIGVELPI